MANSLKKRDKLVLFSLAGFRVLLTGQIGLLAGMNSRGVRRLMGRYLELGFVESIERSFSGSKGRPEGLFCLSQKGINVLNENRLFDSFVSYQKIVWEGRQSLEHQIGVNWVLIHTKILERFVDLKTSSISHTSPFHPESDNGTPFIHDSVSSSRDQSKRIGFTPDAVFSIENPAQQKALLFFLEYDRSTESLVGSKTNSILQKIHNYRDYFRQGGYKRYEKVFNCRFNGFRLLFVSENEERHCNLCRLVQDQKPSDFIWLAGIKDIKARGIGSKIWIRGGDINASAESIIGNSLAFDIGESCP